MSLTITSMTPGIDVNISQSTDTGDREEGTATSHVDTSPQVTITGGSARLLSSK